MIDIVNLSVVYSFKMTGMGYAYIAYLTLSDFKKQKFLHCCFNHHHNNMKVFASFLLPLVLMSFTSLAAASFGAAPPWRLQQSSSNGGDSVMVSHTALVQGNHDHEPQGNGEHESRECLSLLTSVLLSLGLSLLWWLGKPAKPKLVSALSTVVIGKGGVPSRRSLVFLALLLLGLLAPSDHALDMDIDIETNAHVHAGFSLSTSLPAFHYNSCVHSREPTTKW
jgi:hypothetical protein